ncbi:hypothetical protein MDUV_47390 [Mycolicibacterium duvalii]|uniref:Stage II sporulation protein M n=1 Tax=Mycolicibacterium duvalii TaxID=39688 RepID=A0A7I7K8J1_9MYCO|nr:hypothetical protein MDUV_47390 [Mycolicibacterium duvalii]
MRIISQNGGAYLATNAAMYGLLVIGFALGLLFPSLSQAQVTRLEEDGTADLVRSLLDNPWLFALTILAVNALTIGAVTIVGPSLIVPFSGVLLFAYWAVRTGMTLVPQNDIGWVALIPHSLTVVIEFQAYILLVVGGHLHGKYWIRPRTVGAESRRTGYLRGLQTLGWLALPALALLVVGAVYEAFSLRYVVHPLAGWLL